MTKGKPGPTGRFPQGKLNEDDRGELQISIGATKEGKVAMDFGSPVRWIGFGPNDARRIAHSLILKANEAEERAKEATVISLPTPTPSSSQDRN